MLERYRATLTRAGGHLRVDLTRYMVENGLVQGDVPGSSFYDVLERANLMQADVVLAALRINTDASLRLAERLVGKRITRCPPCLRGGRRPTAAKPTGDDRIVVKVRRPSAKERGRRRLLGSPLYDRLARVRVGMSVSQLVGRGLRRRDMRIALRRGYVELSA